MMLFSDKTNTIGERVKLALLTRGKTAADIEREIGINKSYISRVINNKIENPKKFIQTLSKHLEISEKWLLTGNGMIDNSENNALDVFDVSENEYSNLKLYLSCSKLPGKAYLSAFTGIEFNAAKGAIIIMTQKFSHDSGDYIAKKHGTYEVLTRSNTLYGCDWYSRREGITKIENISEYEICGKIMIYIQNNDVGKIEIEVQGG